MRWTERIVFSNKLKSSFDGKVVRGVRKEKSRMLQCLPAVNHQRNLKLSVRNIICTRADFCSTFCLPVFVLIAKVKAEIAIKLVC